MLQSSLFGNRDRANRGEKKLTDFLGRNAPQSNLPSLQNGTPPSSASQGARLLKAKEATASETPQPKEPEACYCTVQGKRPYQEDQFAICPFLQDSSNPGVSETHFYGVFDGHAGGRCSKAIATAIPINLAKDDAYKTKLIQAIKRTISRTNEQFLEIAERMRLNDGSTGVCCVLRDGKLIVANVGDSRAILISGGKSVALTKDHKPSSPEEQRRIASFGGVITTNTGIPRVQGVLAVSRAFGNYSIRHYIRADPDIITRDLTPDDEFVVIASDGLWDVYRNSEVAEIVCTMDQQGCKLQRIADHLVQNALLKGSLDNVTCVIVRISQYVARAMNDSLPPHLQQQGQFVDTNARSRTASGASVMTPKYDTKAWLNASGADVDEDNEIGNDLEAVSVYYPPGGIGSLPSSSYAPSGTGNPSRHAAAEEEEHGKKQTGSRQLSRSRSTSRLTKGGSRRGMDPYGMEADPDLGVEGNQYNKKSQRQNINLNVTITVGDSGDQSNANSGSRGNRPIDSGGQAVQQLPFPSSAYRSMQRPNTQASIQSTPSAASSQLESVGTSRAPSVQKALFVPSAYASQMHTGGSSVDTMGNDSTYSGSRSYVLFGGNNMIPVRAFDRNGNEQNLSQNRPLTSTNEAGQSVQRAHAAKRSELFSYGRQAADAASRPYSATASASNSNPNKAAAGPQLGALGVNTGANRFGNMPSVSEHLKDFPAPHSPIATTRKR